LADLDGSGRSAQSPAGIPPPGWKQVLWRLWREAISDHLGMAAASCAFYAMFALFPAISVMISIYGLLIDPASVEPQLQAIEAYLPQAAYEMIAGRVRDLAAKAPSALTWNLVISTLIALWSASAATRGMLVALNVAYEEEEKRSLIRFHLTALALTLGGIFILILGLTAIVGLPTLLKVTWFGALGNMLLSLLTFSLLLGFLIFWLAILYRFGPSRRQAQWRWISSGSVLAAILWILASALFSFYVANFASYDAMYGSLGAVMIVLLWFFISAYAVLLGAELNAELELQTARDTTTGGPRPMGKRGAFVADHVATSS
jgi:membrane protein